jgi:hypothetical protein
MVSRGSYGLTSSDAGGMIISMMPAQGKDMKAPNTAAYAIE